MHRPDTQTLSRSLRRHWKLFLLCTLLVPFAAVAISLVQDKRYTASASLLFRDPGFDEKLFGTPFFTPSQDADREAATNLQLVSLDVVARRAAERLGGRTQEQVSDAVTVSSEAGSNVIAVTAEARSPADAAKLANVFAEEYIAFRKEADRSKIREAQNLVRRQLAALPSQQRDAAAGRQLRQRSGELEILASLQTGNAELVQQADAPPSASSPRPVRNGVVGLVLGMLLGAAMVLLASRVDRRLHDLEEVGEIVDRPVVAAIPESKTMAGRGQVGWATGVDAEAYRMLRANLLYFNVKKQIRSVLVTSGAPGEGKTTVSLNLAVAAAQTGARVVIVEADLRHPMLAQRMGRLDSPSVGLSTVLATDSAPEMAIVTVPLDNAGGDASERSVDVLFAGPLPPNPTDLMESKRLGELLRRLQEMYDLVVIDTAPVAVVSDAIPLLPQVSGVLVVARLGQTSRDGLRRLKRQLDHVQAPILGVVANGLKQMEHGYGYGYGYGYGNGDGAPGQSEQLDDAVKA